MEEQKNETTNTVSTNDTTPKVTGIGGIFFVELQLVRIVTIEIVNFSNNLVYEFFGGAVNSITNSLSSFFNYDLRNVSQMKQHCKGKRTKATNGC